MEAAALSASRRRTRVTSDANRYPAAETPARSVSVPDARRSLRLSSITKPDGIETQDPDLSQDLLNDTGVSPAPARELRFSPSRPTITTDRTVETSRGDDDDEDDEDDGDDTRKKTRLSVVNEGSLSEC